MKSNKPTDIAIIIIFSIVLLLPFVGMVFNIEPKMVLKEQRIPARFPEMGPDLKSIVKFPIALGEYFERTYGFRALLINLHTVIMADYFGNIDKKSVLFGKDGWLFWAGDKELDQYRAISPFTVDELRRYRRILKERVIFCRERRIRYLFVVSPNKTSIYPEYMPEWITKASSESYLDQLTTFIKDDPEIPFIDLRPYLLSAKRQAPLYYKNDTHWNSYGAFIGYQAMMKKITEWFPQIKPFKFSDYNIEYVPKTGGDMPVFLSAESKYTELEPKFRPKYTTRYYNADIEPFYMAKKTISRPLLITKVNDPTLLKCLIFNDSMMINLKPFVSEHFRKTIYIWDYLSHNFEDTMVEYDKPDLVITEQGERFIKRLNENTVPVRQAYLRWLYKKSVLQETAAKTGIDISRNIKPDGKTSIEPRGTDIILNSAEKKVSFKIESPQGTAVPGIVRVTIDSPSDANLAVSRPEGSQQDDYNNFSIMLKKGPNEIFINMEGLKKDKFILLSIDAVKSISLKNPEMVKTSD